jgi:hypothetical protein
VILDRLADLRSLAAVASSTASTSTEEAAFADVQGRIAGARSVFSSLGMTCARPLQLLTPTEQKTIAHAGDRLRKALEAIAAATDEELAAYASGTAERGSLLAVARQASALREELISAQQILLLRLADEIWPRADVLRLDVISHIGGNRGVAEAARRAELVHQRLTQRSASPDGALTEELEALIDDATRAAADAKTLRGEPVPDEVVDFWLKASSDEGAALDELTVDVRNWLEQHAALGSFTISRAR